MISIVKVIICAFIFTAGAVMTAAAEKEDFDDLFESIPESAGEESLDPGEDGLSLRGDHNFIYRYPLFPDESGYRKVLTRPELNSVFGLRYEYDRLKIVSDWKINIYPLEESILSARAGDNYLSFAPGRFLFEFGYYVQTWGAADGINPVDHLNPKDYSRGFEPETVPAFMLRAVFYPADVFSIEAVAQPYAKADILPVDPAAAVPSSFFDPGAVTVTEPEREPESEVPGLKLNLYTPAADASLSYLYDFDPYYTPDITQTAPAVFSLNLYRQRIHRFGADVKTTVSRFAFWLEAAFNITSDFSMDDAAVRNPYIAWTAGSDFNFGPDDAFYLNFQYYGRYIFGFYNDFFKDYPGGLPDPVRFATEPDYALLFLNRALSNQLGNENEQFLNGFILRTEYPLDNQRWIPSLSTIYFLPFGYDTDEKTRYGSLMLNPVISYRPVPSVELNLGSRLMFAWMKPAGSDDISIDKSDRIGMRHNQSTVYLEAVYRW